MMKQMTGQHAHDHHDEEDGPGGNGQKKKDIKSMNYDEAPIREIQNQKEEKKKNRLSQDLQDQ